MRQPAFRQLPAVVRRTCRCRRAVWKRQRANTVRRHPASSRLEQGTNPEFMGEWGGWSGRRDSNPRQPAWKADTHTFTAWKPRSPFHSALLTAVHCTTENTAVAKGIRDFLPRHALQL